MIYYNDWTQIPTPHLVLGILSVMFFLMYLIGPVLKLVTKIFCLPRDKVYRIYVLLKITKWVLLGLILLGWIVYGK